MIDYENIMELIGVELKSIINSDNENFGKYNFTLTNEIQFVKDKKNKEALKNNPNQVFIVLKFYPATLNFGQTLLPIQLDVISEKNKLDTCKRLLTIFAETYNLEFNSEQTIKQYYQSPSVMSNFNEIGDGYRSLLTLRGTLQISENANLSTLKYVVDSQTQVELPLITFGMSFDIQLDTQSMYNEDNVTKSWARVGTNVITFTMYLTDTTFLNRVLAIINKDFTTMPNGINTDFGFILAFKNGITINTTMKLANVGIQQNIAELPVASLTFTN